MASCSATTGSSTVSRRFQRSDADADLLLDDEERQQRPAEDEQQGDGRPAAGR